MFASFSKKTLALAATVVAVLKSVDTVQDLVGADGQAPGLPGTVPAYYAFRMEPNAPLSPRSERLQRLQMAPKVKKNRRYLDQFGNLRPREKIEAAPNSDDTEEDEQVNRHGPDYGAIQGMAVMRQVRGGNVRGGNGGVQNGGVQADGNLIGNSGVAQSDSDEANFPAEDIAEWPKN
jgi:hypothetical protein